MMDQQIMERIQEAHYLSQDLQQKMELVEQEIGEMKKFEETVNELNKTKEKEILANVGKGVFMKAEIKEEKLFIDVGRGIYVRKTVKEAKEIVEGQVKRLNEMKRGLEEQTTLLREEMQIIIENNPELMQHEHSDEEEHDHEGHDHAHDHKH